MNQLAIEFQPRCTVPPAQSQAYALLQAFQRGERLTVLSAIEKYGVYALSQRCGELRKAGWPIQSRTITTGTNKRVSEYWLEVSH